MQNYVDSFQVFEAKASIKFDKQPKKTKEAKTDLYNVYKGDVLIGVVKWYHRVRSYAFMPAPECTDEIKGFVKLLMDKRKKSD